MKRKVLISGIYYEGGGLGNLMNYLATHLSKDFDISCIAFHPAVHPNPQKLERSGQQVYNIPYQRNRFRIPDGHEICEQIINHQFDAVIILGPLKLNAVFIDQLRELNNRMLLVAFLPYEGKVINLFDAPLLNKIDFGVFYSKFTYDCFQELNTYSEAIPDFYWRFGYVSHGIDKEKFYPLSAGREKKKVISRSFISEYQNLPKDAFIVLNSNKPFYRKGIDSTLVAFKQFSDQRNNCFLHLHLGSISKASYDQILEKIDALSLKDLVIVTYSEYPSKAHTDEWMNYLYNACDVGLSSSYGEGWGLGIFEHAATGAPVIVPKHTAFKENWEDVALLTEIAEVKYLAAENTDVYLSSPDSICNALIKLYDSVELYETYSVQCYQHAISSKYNWENTSAYFADILNTQQIHLPSFN